MMRHIILLCLVLYILFLLDIALFHFPSTNPSPNFLPLRTIIGDLEAGWWELVVNLLGNIIAFVPIGWLPPLARPRRATAWQAAILCLSVSLFIEVNQYFSGRRVTDIDDLILNTLGGVLGYYSLIGLRSRPGRTAGGTEEGRANEQAGRR